MLTCVDTKSSDQHGNLVGEPLFGGFLGERWGARSPIGVEPPMIIDRYFDVIEGAIAILSEIDARICRRVACNYDTC